MSHLSLSSISLEELRLCEDHHGDYTHLVTYGKRHSVSHLNTCWKPSLEASDQIAAPHLRSREPHDGEGSASLVKHVLKHYHSARTGTLLI